VDVALRPVAPGDRPFLRAVFASTKGPELALLAGDDSLHERFLGTQFVQFERALASEATTDFVIVADGRDVGRVALGTSDSTLHVVDIAIVTSERNKGIGTAVLEMVIDVAERDGRDITLNVDRGNPARRLYERLGFTVAGESDIQLLCIRRAARAGD
jgi:ribosomal protein S18 acetylase RimI-like enzyme